jgi:D-alanyl-lipoteichoic acid acyltransferase DltB (MBOAT superfamily)
MLQLCTQDCFSISVDRCPSIAFLCIISGKNMANRNISTCTYYVVVVVLSSSRCCLVVVSSSCCCCLVFLLLFQNASNYVQEKGFKQTKFIDSAVLLDFEKPLCCSVLCFFSITEYIVPQHGQSLTDAQTASNANRERIHHHYWEGIKHHVRKVLNSCP